ncbi:MAG: response regulator [Candidatus Sumerlaeaceae bacterium]
MAGESILVVDDSVAVQELCKNVLESGGYRVSVASNGVAALSYPDLPDIDLLIIDTHLRDISGYEAAKQIKTDEELFRKPVLLLLPEEASTDRESQDLLGANSFLKKPFEANHLLNKVQMLLEEKEILERGREYLRKAADDLMKRMAETHIQQAVDQKTQIMIERALQMVVTQVDLRARREVDSKVTQLTTEKEQELVKVTVHEVARSMVEKIAEKRVKESMDLILQDETEKAVRRAAESILPNSARERVKESIEQLLPKEVTRRVAKEAEDLVPEASQKVVLVIESAAQKLVPKIAKDIVVELTDRHLASAIDSQLPRHVQGMVATELDAQVRLKLAPLVREATDKVRKRITFLLTTMLIILTLATGLLVADYLFGPFIPRRERATVKQPVTAQPAPKNPLEELFGGRFKKALQPPAEAEAPKK